MKQINSNLLSEATIQISIVRGAGSVYRFISNKYLTGEDTFQDKTICLYFKLPNHQICYIYKYTILRRDTNLTLFSGTSLAFSVTVSVNFSLYNKQAITLTLVP